jgi:hypothetical protein
VVALVTTGWWPGSTGVVDFGQQNGRAVGQERGAEWARSWLPELVSSLTLPVVVGNPDLRQSVAERIARKPEQTSRLGLVAARTL